MKENNFPKPPVGFRVHSETLKSALKKVMPVANSKANVLPIVNGNVKVCVNGSEAVIMATDLTTTISVKVPVNGLTHVHPNELHQEEQQEMLLLSEVEEDISNDEGYFTHPENEAEYEEYQHDEYYDNASDFEVEEPKVPRYKRKAKKEAEATVEVLEQEEAIIEEETNDVPFDADEDLPEWYRSTQSEETDEEELSDDEDDDTEQLPYEPIQEDESTFETDNDEYSFLLPIESLPVIEALNCPVELTCHQGVITITTDTGSTYRFVPDPVEDYPNKRKRLNPDFKFHLPSEILYKTVKGVSFAVGEDNLRPAMTGIYVEKSTDESIRLVATNAQILLYKTIDAQPLIINEEENFNPSAIMPPIAFKLLAGTTGLVSIACDIKNQLLEFNVEGVKVRCSFVEGVFPSYRTVIPSTEPLLAVTVGKSQMLSTLKRAKTLCDEASNRLIIAVHADEMKLICNKQLDSDGSIFNTMDETLKVRTEVEKSQTEFPKMIIGVNVKLFYDIILQGCTTDTLVLSFYAPDRAIMINASEKEAALIMPVLIQ